MHVPLPVHFTLYPTYYQTYYGEMLPTNFPSVINSGITIVSGACSLFASRKQWKPTRKVGSLLIALMPCHGLKPTTAASDHARESRIHVKLAAGWPVTFSIAYPSSHLTYSQQHAFLLKIILVDIQISEKSRPLNRHSAQERRPSRADPAGKHSAQWAEATCEGK